MYILKKKIIKYLIFFLIEKFFILKNACLYLSFSRNEPVLKVRRKVRRKVSKDRYQTGSEKYTSGRAK